MVRLLVKNLGRKMPESEVREELEVLGITVVSVLQLQSHRRATDTEGQASHSSLHCDGAKRANGQQGTRSRQSVRSSYNGRDVPGSQGPIAVQELSAVRAHSTQLWLPS